MPKQSSVKKPRLAPVRELLNAIFERLCKLETNTVNAEDLAEGQQIFESRMLSKFNDLDARVADKCEHLGKQMLSDFDDQDDEIEKISRRLQSVEDKLKGKVELVNSAQREVNEAHREIVELEARLKASNEARDCALEARDMIKAVYDEFRVMYAEMESKLAASERKPKPLFWGRFGELRKRS